MAFRNVVVSKTSALSLEQNNMKLVQEDMSLTIPICDISTLMIDARSQISSSLLVALAENDVAVYICNDKHLPTTISLPFQSHNKQFKRIEEQLSISKPLQKQLWQKIIVAKISNQAEVLGLIGYEVESKKLRNFAGQVNSGDTLNIEAIAANSYFRTLFGDKFSRDQENNINSFLNYGYSILRGLVARNLVIYGFLPSIGIWHHNQYNNFNLADDVIEPFRPIIDLFVVKNLEIFTVLDPKSKKLLWNIPALDTLISKKKQTLNNAIEILVQSLVSSIQNDSSEYLSLPQAIEIQIHQYE